MADEPSWLSCEGVLETIETKMRECRSNFVKRCEIYDDTVNIHRPWYWLQPECEFEEVSDAASDLFHCDAMTYHGIVIKTRNEKRELLDAERKFVQTLHFNVHVRSRHACELTYRDACYFGVDVVWCESNATNSNEVDGTNVLACLRHLFAKPKYVNMNDDDTLPYLRVLFADKDRTKESLRERYIRLLWNLKHKVLSGQCSGIRFHATIEKMMADAIHEGLTQCEFYSIYDEIDANVDYTRLRVYVAPFD
jgi:hypothetical protein